MTTLWTPVKQILRVAHPALAEERLVTALIAYFDESGKPDDRPVVSLGAFVATDLKWRKFEVQWRKALYDYKVPIHKKYKIPYFHMTDFESPKSKDYGKWDKNKKIGLISKLASIINRTIVFGSVHSLIVDQWNEIICPDLTDYEEQRGWYLFLLQEVLNDIGEMVRVPQYENIACVFDTNNEVSHAAITQFELLKKFRKWGSVFGSSTYANSIQFSPLQAADILAFEGRMTVHNKIIDGGMRPIRKLLDSLQAKGCITVAHSDREGLMKVKADWLAYLKFKQRLEKLRASSRVH